MSKYKSKKVYYDGKTFDSKKEASRYCDLIRLEKSGKIQGLRCQVPFVLADSVVLNGRKKPPLRYFADFVYTEDGKQIVEDTKSAITRKCPLFRAKKHLMKSVHGIEIKES